MAPDREPYNSWGNGAAMRISPVGLAYDTLDEVLDRATAYTVVTHDHPEGLKGAQATAAAIFLARTGNSKADIRKYTTTTFGYDLSLSVDEIRPTYEFDESCQRNCLRRSYPSGSNSSADTIRNAISLGETASRGHHRGMAHAPRVSSDFISKPHRYSPRLSRSNLSLYVALLLQPKPTKLKHVTLMSPVL